MMADWSQGPRSHLYSHILTSCFLDTVLVPLCSWLYLLALSVLLFLSAKRHSSTTRRDRQSPIASVSESKITVPDVEVNTFSEGGRRARGGKTRTILFTLYMLLLLAQVLMCILEIVRLSLAKLGIGLLPFTFVTLILAGTLRWSLGFGERIFWWQGANVAVWIALAVTNGVKVAEEVNEGTGRRKGTKYPESDEIIDVSVMIGVYVALMVLEVLIPPARI